MRCFRRLHCFLFVLRAVVSFGFVLSEGRVVSMVSLGVWYQLGAGSCCPVSVRAVVSMKCSFIRCLRRTSCWCSFSVGFVVSLVLCRRIQSKKASTR